MNSKLILLHISFLKVSGVNLDLIKLKIDTFAYNTVLRMIFHYLVSLIDFLKTFILH